MRYFCGVAILLKATGAAAFTAAWLAANEAFPVVGVSASEVVDPFNVCDGVNFFFNQVPGFFKSLLGLFKAVIGAAREPEFAIGCDERCQEVEVVFVDFNLVGIKNFFCRHGASLLAVSVMSFFEIF